ncbi:MAG: mycofactocin glycosyltransferase [Thermoleophilaceae bacterium]|nr:mycofactocin glycosyltransferase [Thermoleophilaceae bacterium]
MVATRDRAERLSALLAALAAQTLPRERFETIVVDDGSRDATPGVLDAAPVDRVLRHESARGPAGARNTGWRAARGALVAFTDDDCRPEPGWLEAGLAAHRAAPGALVQGRTRPEPEGEPLLDHPRARSLRVDRPGPFFQTCNVFYPRELLERLDGFDERAFGPSSEDADLAWRALEAGARAVFAPGALVSHAVSVFTLAQALRFAPRWRTLPALVRRHPPIRRELPWRGRVWREAHGRLLMALAGLALMRTHRAFALWCLPYLTLRRGWRPRPLLRAASELPGVAAVDAAELAVLACASARARTLLL